MGGFAAHNRISKCTLIVNKRRNNRSEENIAIGLFFDCFFGRFLLEEKIVLVVSSDSPAFVK